MRAGIARRSPARRLVSERQLAAVLDALSPASLATLTTDRRHVRAVAADGSAALATRCLSFLDRELVRVAALVCGPTTEAGDLTLALG